MGNCVFLVFVITVVVLVIVLIFQDLNGEKERKSALHRMANELRFDFLPRIASPYPIPAYPVDLFSRTQRSRTINLIKGNQGNLEIMVFDFVIQGYKVEYMQTVACLHIASAHLPEFHLHPETLSQVISKWFGKPDIDFDNDMRFSNCYLLQGTDEKAIRRLFGEKLRTFYKSKANVSTEVVRDYFLYYKRNMRIAPEELPAFLSEALDAFMLCLDASKQPESLPKPVNSVNLE